MLNLIKTFLQRAGWDFSALALKIFDVRAVNNPTPRHIDSHALHLIVARQAMQVKLLMHPFHCQQVTILEVATRVRVERSLVVANHLDVVDTLVEAEIKRARGPKRQRNNKAILSIALEQLLIVSVPADRLSAVFVGVQIHRIWHLVVGNTADLGDLRGDFSASGVLAIPGAGRSSPVAL